MRIPNRGAMTLMAGLLLAGAAAVCAQDYPGRSVRIVTFGVGGSGDFASRVHTPSQPGGG